MIYSIGNTVDYTRLVWQSDWDGEDVGFDDVLIVGLYNDPNHIKVSYHIDIETSKILEVLIEGEDEEC